MENRRTKILKDIQLHRAEASVLLKRITLEKRGVKTFQFVRNDYIGSESRSERVVLRKMGGADSERSVINYLRVVDQ
jgi:hypothetical protein